MAETKITGQGTADFDWDALAMDGYNKIQRAELADKYEATLKNWRDLFKTAWTKLTGFWGTNSVCPNFFTTTFPLSMMSSNYKMTSSK